MVLIPILNQRFEYSFFVNRILDIKFLISYNNRIENAIKSQKELESGAHG